MRILLDDISVPLGRALEVGGELDESLGGFIAERCRVEPWAIVSYRILRRSVDARNRRAIRINYQLEADFIDTPALVGRLRNFPAPPSEPSYLFSLSEPSSAAPRQAVVVGTGPAGLMAAWLLARQGREVVVVDRGGSVPERDAGLARFLERRELDVDNNYLYGEGGAGAYSDGKLYTRGNRDGRLKFVLSLLVEAGAPESIKYLQRPHIGSDRLPGVVVGLRKMIESHGGRFLWNHQVVDILVERGRCAGVVLADGETVRADATLIAPGHSARGLILKLVGRGVRHRLKDFQIGCRIEHRQEFVNFMQYGVPEPPRCLGAAEYNLVSRPPHGAPGATTFCMCPGGAVIPATSEPGQLATNGMSNHARDGRFANAAIIVNQKGGDFRDAAAAFDFLERLERQIYGLGGGDYSAPTQDAYSFARGEAGGAAIESSYPLGTRPADLRGLMPGATADGIVQALLRFEKLAPGFVTSGNLVGIETRVSSPVRFERLPQTLESSVPGLFLAGEGAGQAGGIVSAAVDGLRLAEAMLDGG